MPQKFVTFKEVSLKGHINTSNPEASYCLRFSGSERMPYEYATSLNFSAASGLLVFLSGWYLKKENPP